MNNLQEIKFKAWFPNKNKMTQSFSVLDITPKMQKTIQEEKAIILQFTNAKDKNGNEIYEGDILDYYNMGIRKVEFDFSETQFVAKKINRASGALWPVSVAYAAPSSKVIGSIYKTPIDDYTPQEEIKGLIRIANNKGE